MEITFENLPKAVTQLFEKLNGIEALIKQQTTQPAQEQDELLTVQDTAKFLSLSVPTVYGLISKGELPVMKRSKRCYFSKVELINYLKQGRKKTNTEIEAIAEKHVSKKPR
jgi:excisionase family DNA binding protein